MPYAFGFTGEGVRQWTLTEGGATADLDRSYRPAVYVSAPDESALATPRGFIRDLPAVEHTTTERKRTGWRRDPEPVLRAGVRDVDSVRDVATTIRRWDDPGTYRPFDVDLSPGFRYCLDTGVDPVPGRRLTTLRVAVPERDLGAASGERVACTVGGEELRGEASAVVERLAARVAEVDPDVLVLGTTEVIPWAFDVAAFDEHREPAAVCDRLERHLRRLRTGDVSIGELAVCERASKRARAYDRETRVAAALERAAARGLDRHPGQSISYVVTDDGRSGRERVAHPGEAERYDAGFYADLLVRAAAEVTTPLGWRERDVRRHLAARTDASLAAYG